MSKDLPANTPASSANSRTRSQGFRSRGKVVYIPAVQHRESGNYYIIWSDIQDCFPGVVRVLHDDIYVPMLRNNCLYRVKPHGIEYHPNVILIVDYENHAGFTTAVTSKPRTTTTRPNRKLSQPNVGNQKANPRPALAPLSMTATPSSSSVPSALSSPLLESSAALSESDHDLSEDLAMDEVADEREVGVVAERPSPIDLAMDEAAAENEEDTIDLAIDEVAAEQKKVEDSAEVHNWETGTQHEPKVEGEEEEVGRNDHSEQPVSKDGGKANGRNTIVHSGTGTAHQEDENQIEEPSSGEEGQGVQENLSFTIKPEAVSFMVETVLKQAEEEAGEKGLVGFPALLSHANEQKKLEKSRGPEPPSSFLDHAIHKSVVREQYEDPRVLDTVAIAMARAKKILDERYLWRETVCPKLFVILPGVQAVREISEEGSDRMPCWADFQVHFLCDCGDIEEALLANNNPPHFSLDSTAMSYRIKPGKEEELLKKFGSYMLALLEFMQYVDRNLTTLPIIIVAIHFLRSCGVEGLMKVFESQFEEGTRKLKESAPVDVYGGLHSRLTAQDLSDLGQGILLKAGTPIGDKYPYMTKSGDLRWLCDTHRTYVVQDAFMVQLGRLMIHPDSKRTRFIRGSGSFRSRVTSREQARKIYKLAKEATECCAVNLFVDWKLNLEDIDELSDAILNLVAPCVKIFVLVEKVPGVDFPNFGHPYDKMIASGLLNKRIESFSLSPSTDFESTDGSMAMIYDLAHFEEQSSLGMNLAMYLRDPVTGKIDLSIKVLAFDRAAMMLRQTLQGFHHFSRLEMEYEFWEYVGILFGAEADCPPSKKVKDEDRVDMHYGTDTAMKIFDKRKCDSINIRSASIQTTAFLETSRLKDVILGFDFTKHTVLIRNLIRRNPGLEKLELMVVEGTDPSQVFEYYKALFANHGKLKEFVLRINHVAASASNFKWEGLDVSGEDLKGMSLVMECCAGDKIGTLLQKFASCLRRLSIRSMDSQQSAILEKVTRAKKAKDRGIRLETIQLIGSAMYPQAVVDDLTKIILRCNSILTAVEVFVNCPTKVVEEEEGAPLNEMALRKVANLITDIGPKITALYLRGEATPQLIQALEKRLPRSFELSSLTDLSLGGPWNWMNPAQDLEWFCRVIKASRPTLCRFHMDTVNLSTVGWLTVFQDLNFLKLTDVRIRPEVVLTVEAFKALMEAIPEKGRGPPLSSLVVHHEDTMAPVEELALRRKLMGKIRDLDKAFVRLNEDILT